MNPETNLLILNCLGILALVETIMQKTEIKQIIFKLLILNNLFNQVVLFKSYREVFHVVLNFVIIPLWKF